MGSKEKLIERFKKLPKDFTFFPITQYGDAMEQREFPTFSKLLDCFYEQRERLDRVLRAHPELALPMLQYLARTVRLLSEQLDDMAFRPAQWRLARFLLSGADRLSTVHSTQDEMAASISASRVTVSRVLGEFTRLGWLRTGYRALFLTDDAALRAFAFTD